MTDEYRNFWTDRVPWSDLALFAFLSVCVVTCGWSPRYLNPAQAKAEFLSMFHELFGGAA